MPQALGCRFGETHPEPRGAQWGWGGVLGVCWGNSSPSPPRRPDLVGRLEGRLGDAESLPRVPSWVLSQDPLIPLSSRGGGLTVTQSTSQLTPSGLMHLIPVSSAGQLPPAAGVIGEGPLGAMRGLHKLRPELPFPGRQWASPSRPRCLPRGHVDSGGRGSRSRGWEGRGREGSVYQHPAPPQRGRKWDPE